MLEFFTFPKKIFAPGSAEKNFKQVFKERVSLVVAATCRQVLVPFELEPFEIDQQQSFLQILVRVE